MLDPSQDFVFESKESDPNEKTDYKKILIELKLPPYSQSVLKVEDSMSLEDILYQITTENDIDLAFGDLVICTENLARIRSITVLEPKAKYFIMAASNFESEKKKQETLAKSKPKSKDLGFTEIKPIGQTYQNDMVKKERRGRPRKYPPKDPREAIKWFTEKGIAIPPNVHREAMLMDQRELEGEDPESPKNTKNTKKTEEAKEQKER